MKLKTQQKEMWEFHKCEGTKLDTPEWTRVKEQIQRKLKKYSEIRENENIYQNLWDTAKAMFRGKFIVLNTYIKYYEQFHVV